MAISFTRTRNQIAQRVLGKVIKVGATTVATADYDTVYEAIDLRLKELHRLGAFWRKIGKIPLSFDLTAAVASASASVDILFPLKITVADSSADQPVDLISPRQYAAIENKNEGGFPTKALWVGSAEFHFHPVPTVATTAKLVYEKIADDTSASAAVDVDVAMIRALTDLIKYDVADDFGIPEQTVTRWEREALKADKILRGLTALRVDYSTVKVDEWTPRPQDSAASNYGN